MRVYRGSVEDTILVLSPMLRCFTHGLDLMGEDTILVLSPTVYATLFYPWT
jgi:hypothetical protein